MRCYYLPLAASQYCILPKCTLLPSVVRKGLKTLQRSLKIHKPMKCSFALHSQQYFFQSFHFITTSLQFIQYLVTCCMKCFPALEMHAASGRFFFSRVKSP
ncbi:unnamed protein product [Pipistrellus nathusii]|uniref:Uncharacterized protein n=1 Tax=Pipistrellus nathusii TaxID=59473 RepID=A0ABN9ZY00_PIPNA